MSIIEILQSSAQPETEGLKSTYCGPLADYLTSGQCQDETVKYVYEKVNAAYPQAGICTGLNITVNPNIVPNQIIRYKDVAKLNGKGYPCADILYFTNESGAEKAMLYTPLTSGAYLLVKGEYLVLTEPGSAFEPYRNDIVALASSDVDFVINTVKDLFRRNAGGIQRFIERKIYGSYELLLADAVKMADGLATEAKEKLVEMDDRAGYIQSCVLKWFMLKKVVYVSYMLDKNILNNVHEGNSKAQRTQAKANADTIKFIPYSEMWRISRPKPRRVRTIDPLDAQTMAEAERIESYNESLKNQQ